MITDIRRELLEKHRVPLEIWGIHAAKSFEYLKGRFREEELYLTEEPTGLLLHVAESKIFIRGIVRPFTVVLQRGEAAPLAAIRFLNEIGLARQKYRLYMRGLEDAAMPPSPEYPGLAMVFHRHTFECVPHAYLSP